jgi:hypothetical protein
VFGFEPGTGVSVATIVAELLIGTPAGAVSCSAKLLAMLRVTEACFEASATGDLRRGAHAPAQCRRRASETPPFECALATPALPLLD